MITRYASVPLAELLALADQQANELALEISSKWQDEMLEALTERDRAFYNEAYDEGYTDGAAEAYDEGFDDGKAPRS